MKNKCIVCGAEINIHRTYCSRACVNSPNSPRNKKLSKSQKMLHNDENKKQEILTKRKETCLEKYGSECASQTSEFRKKVKETMNKKYGVDNPMQCNKFKENHKKKLIENYGVDNPSKSLTIQNKKINTMLKKYSIKYPYEYEEFYRKMKDSLGGRTKPELELEKEFKESRIEYLIEYPISFENTTKYYDFYLPKFNLLIEFDGEYWHKSEEAKNNDKIKNALAKNNGYNLVRIRGEKNIKFVWEIVI